MSLHEFWDCTYGEILLHIDVYNEKKIDEVKLQARMVYQLAQLMTAGTGVVLNGGTFPSIHDTFPELFDQEVVDVAEQVNEKNKWLAFAQAHNAKRKEAQEHDH